MLTYLVCQGHTLEYAKSLPLALLSAISTAIEDGFIGFDAERLKEYRAYRQWAVTAEVKPEHIVSLDEYLPPVGASAADVEEARNQRMEAAFDEGVG